MKFTDEILVSFAAADDLKSEGRNRGWISDFVYFLEMRFAQLFNKQIKIIHNPDCKTLFQLGSGKMHITVVSTKFLASPTCRDFLKGLHTGEDATGAEGINSFFVQIDPVDQKTQKEYPDILNSYEFFRPDQAGQERMLLTGGEVKLEYFLALENLAFDIYTTNLSSSEDFAKLMAGTLGRGEKIFLGFAGKDTKAQRNRVKWELEHFGFRVVPMQQVNPDAKHSRNMTEEMLSGSILSVHLIGSDFDPNLGKTNSFSPEMHNAVAADFSKTHNLLRLIWIPPTLDISDEKEYENLSRLRDDADAIRSAEIFQVPIEEFTRVVLTKIEEVRSGVGAKTDSENGPTDASLYLIYQFKDIKAADALRLEMQTSGVQVIMLEGSSSSLETKRRHQQHLIECDAAMIFYTDSNSIWLETKVNDLRKSAGMGRSGPIPMKALLLENGAKLPQWEGIKDEFEILQSDGKKDPAAIRDFVSRMKRNQTGKS